MKIVVASDSHGNDVALEKIVKACPNADLYLFAGDSESSSNNISPFLSVKGNCDYYPYDEFMLIDTPYGKLQMHHIPFYSESSYERSKKIGVKILIFGHTHIFEDKEVDGIRIINPGSISYSRRGDEGYVILEISSNKVEVIHKII